MTKRIIWIATAYILGVALMTGLLYITNRYLFPDIVARSVWSYLLQSAIVLAFTLICVFVYRRIAIKKRGASDSE